MCARNGLLSVQAIEKLITQSSLDPVQTLYSMIFGGSFHQPYQLEIHGKVIALKKFH